MAATATQTRVDPDFSRELSAGGIVAGIDEAGRGPLAGPVVAAAVVLRPERLPVDVFDSKVMTELERDAAFRRLQETALFGIGAASVAEIDRVNILQATLLAMRRAYVALLPRLADPPRLVLVDGNRAPALPSNTETVVDGDALCLSIAAASIVAKVTRDRLMRALDRRYFGYGWATNRGYGTEEHRLALSILGPTPHHRRSFAPMRPAKSEQIPLSL
ncbi:MAG: ribonuclease HII [Alphaproteobacteria bacterium]|nr:ribonuclease HII [Alphaproteobacteria bacterium]